jgi:hypothetical protein
MLLKGQESRRFGLRHGSDEYTAATWRQTSFVPTASVMLDNNIKQGRLNSWSNNYPAVSLPGTDHLVVHHYHHNKLPSRRTKDVILSRGPGTITNSDADGTGGGHAPKLAHWLRWSKRWINFSLVKYSRHLFPASIDTTLRTIPCFKVGSCLEWR